MRWFPKLDFPGDGPAFFSRSPFRSSLFMGLTLFLLLVLGDGAYIFWRHLVDWYRGGGTLALGLFLLAVLWITIFWRHYRVRRSLDPDSLREVKDPKVESALRTATGLIFSSLSAAIWIAYLLLEALKQAVHR